MKHAHELSHHDFPAPAEGLRFSDDEWQHLQAEDRHAARVVVGLMGCIFTTGLVIYCTVALIVSGVM